MSNNIQEAQREYDALNSQVYAALSALGISDQALLTVLRVSTSNTVTSAAGSWSAKVVLKSKTELELTITNGTKLKGIAYRRITDPKTSKVLSEGSRTVSAQVSETQVYSRSAGWPADVTVSVRLNDPANGPEIKLK